MGREQDMGANLEELYKGGTTELPPIAESFTSASSSLDGVNARAGFTRSEKIGLGATGPMAAFDSLVDALVSTTKKSGDVMNDVATNLVKTAQDFAQTDADIRDAFLKAGGKLP